jgi:cytochrome P450
LERPLASRRRRLIEAFVQEVRRFYPFFPMVGGRSLEEFEGRGHRFEKGAWVLLDLCGTNHDARIWNNPERFQPERFLNWQGNPYTLIPQSRVRIQHVRRKVSVHVAGSGNIAHLCSGDAGNPARAN